MPDHDAGRPTAHLARRVGRSGIRRLQRLVRRLRPDRAACPAPSPRGGVPSTSVTRQSTVRGGVVELFEAPWVEGWIAVPRGAPPLAVTLQLNRRDLVTTWPADRARGRRAPGSEVRRFRFVTRDLWDYVGPGDRLRVVVEGRALPIAGHGMVHRPRDQGEHTPADLMAKLAEGHVFSRSGWLQLSKSLDTEWQRRVLVQADRVRRFVADHHGHDVFLIYGSLLGAIREGGFISHDSDLDLAYVSDHRDGAAVARELRDIAFGLIDAGYQVRSFRTHLRISSAIEGHDDVPVDLFHTWFDADDVLQFPFGVASTGQFHRSRWHGVREIDFAGARALLPVAAEEVAEVLYGTGWRQPQPGFNWSRDRLSRARAGLLPAGMVEEIYWADFYEHAEFTSGSNFFDFVDAQEGMPSSVVDVGCGDGRDAVAHATAGRVVVGVDRSHVAVRHATAKADKLGLSERLAFVSADVSDVSSLTEILTSARSRADGGSLLIYLRFFLHSIPEETQELLLDTVAADALAGDVLAAEFRTEQDAEAPKVHGAHYRRYQDGPAFGARLEERYGYEVLVEREGTGLSPYGDEDPHLYRVIARRRDDS